MRCHWAEKGGPEEQAYHDREWGKPHRTDRDLFELVTLEGAQAGLSWRTVLLRREAYRDAFHRFDVARSAAMTDGELEAILSGSGVIRHRQKIWSVRDNARAALDLPGGLTGFLWSFTGGAPIVNHWREPKQVPATTDVSDQLSKALRQRGFRFVGSTICYALMQASGMVNDHLADCDFRGGP